MSLCSFCQRKQTRSRPFVTPSTCQECAQDKEIYNDSNNEEDDIAFIDSYGKKRVMNNLTELNFNIEKTNNTDTKDINEKRVNIDQNDMKDSLLASLYSQVEFLRSEIEEKNLFIRTLLIRESDYENRIYSDAVRNEYCRGRAETVSSISSSETGRTSSKASSMILVEEWNAANVQRFKENEEEVNVTDGERRKEELNEKLQSQIKEVRQQKHNLFQGLLEEKEKFKMPGTNYHNNIKEITHPNEIWPNDTILIIGDSMVNQMDEEKLSQSTGKMVKVRAFGGYGVNDIYKKLDALLMKKPSKIVIHLGTNDATTKSSQIILDDLLKLKRHIELELKGVEVVFSCPIIRIDDWKGHLTVIRLKQKIQRLKVRYLLNDNIKENHLGNKGLHLSNWGVKRFAVN